MNRTVQINVKFTMTTENTTSTSTKSKCPCCYFLTDDLFLPTSERADQQANLAFDLKNIDDERIIVDLNKPLESWEVVLRQTQNKTSALVETNQNNKSSQPLLDVGVEQCLLVDTHGHAHLERESQACYQFPFNDNNGGNGHSNEGSKDLENYDRYIISLTCAVQQSDWIPCLEHASRSSHRMAALGVHPWYLADLTDDWLQELESALMQHPGCMVGEIGLCKMARFVRTYKHGKKAALELQRNVFIQQVKLAGRLKRPVSVHCVNQQGVLLDILKVLNPSKELPPAIALHSFSGTAHQVQQLIRWEGELFERRTTDFTKNSCLTISDPHFSPIESHRKPLLYFGFSHAINYSMCTSDKSKQQGRDAIKAVPRDRILAESDVHNHDNIALGTSSSVAYIAWALDEPIGTILHLTRKNGIRFLNSLSRYSTIDV